MGSNDFRTNGNATTTTLNGHSSSNGINGHSTIDTSSPLRVTIVGAGIAGLTLALALRTINASAQVTLLEKSSFSAHKETGAALYVSPNASGHLLKLGWKPENSGSNKCQGFISVGGLTGEVRNKQEFSFADEKWRGKDGNDRPWLLAHRVDFHHELRRLVLLEEESGQVPGKAARLELGIHVQRIDAESGTVTLEDGRVFESDTIIGADGNNSICRKFLDPDGPKLRPYGKSSYRWLVDREKVLQDPETRRFVETDGYFVDIVGPDRKVVVYPCRNNTTMNMAAFFPDEEVQESGGAECDRNGMKSHLEENVATFHPSIQKLISYAGADLKIYHLMDMDHLKSWNRGRIALVGDAAHPFLSFLGQGAAQAMEDSISIAALLQPDTKTNEITGLLRLYDSIRRKRVNYVVEETIANGTDENKGRPPERMFDVLDNCFSHDEWENTSEKLREWQEQHSGEWSMRMHIVSDLTLLDH